VSVTSIIKRFADICVFVAKVFLTILFCCGGAILVMVPSLGIAAIFGASNQVFLIVAVVASLVGIMATIGMMQLD
jgi:hypothetical protein